MEFLPSTVYSKDIDIQMDHTHQIALESEAPFVYEKHGIVKT